MARRSQRHAIPRQGDRTSQRRDAWGSQRRLRVERLECRTLLAADVYVDDDWAGVAIGSDPDAGGLAVEFGVDAFATLTEAIAAVDMGGTVHVFEGAYGEALSIAKDVTIQAELPGVIDLDAGGAPFAISIGPGVSATVSGFNFGGFVDVGITVQGAVHVESATFTGSGSDGVGVQVAAGASAEIVGAAFDGLAIGVDVSGAASLTANVFGGVTTNLVDLRLNVATDLIAVHGDNTFTATDYYIENRSGLGLDLTTAPATLFDAADGFRIEDRLFHALDAAGSGLVRFAAGQLYVSTPGSGANDETIQAALDSAQAGDTVNVESGLFVGDLLIATADVELIGDGAGSTTIEGVATNLQASFPLATPNINVLASGVSLHGFTILSPAVAAGSYSSGVVIDSPGVEIYDNEFISRQGDASPAGANDSLTNVAIQTWTGANSGKESNVDGLSIHDNTFSGDGKGYYGVFVNPQAQAVGAGPTAAVSIAGNDFVGNIWRAIEVERSNAVISGNQITPGPETLQQWGGSGISVRNFTGDPIADVTLSGNTITGADGASGQGFASGVLVGFGTQAVDLKLESSNIISHHAVGVRVNVGTVNVDGAQLSQNGTGVLIASGAVTLQGAELTGNDTGVAVSSSATATLLGDSTAISGGEIGLDVDGGAALAQGYNFNGNTIGVRVRNGGLADLGQAGAGVNFTSLGVSIGGNDFSSFTDTATSAGGAIVNLNTAGDYAAAGPQGLGGPLSFDVSAIGNGFNVNLTGGAEEVVIYHDVDNGSLGFVEFAELGGLTVSLDTLPTVLTTREIDEGGSVTVAGSFTNVAQAHTVTISWGDGTDTVIPLAAGVFTFTSVSPLGAYADDPDGTTQTTPFAISVLVEELDGADSASDGSLSVGVLNVAPTVPLADADGDNQVDEGGTFNLTLGPVIDPGDDTIAAYQIDWGDGTPLEFVPGGDLSTAAVRSHAYTDGGAFSARTIVVDALDEDGTWLAAGSLTISVNNIAPTATHFLPFHSSVAEGSKTTVFFSEPFFDPGAADGPFRFAYDFNGNGVYGDAGETGDGTYAGSSAVAFAVVPSQFLADDDDSPRSIKGLIIDKDGGATEYSLQVAITNIAPVVNAGADDSAFVGAAVDHLVSFTDPGADADWTVSIDWDGVAGFEETFTVPSRTFNLGDYSAKVFGAGDIGATFTVTVQVDDNDDGVHADTFELTVIEDTLRVVDFAVNPSGFRVRFNRAIDLAVLNLYNGFFDTTVDQPDLMLVGGAVGPVSGTIEWDAAANTLEFVKTGGLLPPDTYTLTLVSGAHSPAVNGSIAFQDVAGADLDGDGDTVTGDHYVQTFVVAATPRVLGLPDFARGPGQAIDLSPTTTGPGTLELPIVLSDANGVFSVDFDMIYDPTVLSIAVPNNNVSLGPTMPSGWNALANLISPGLLRVSVTGTQSLSGANLAIVDLAATVLPTALYGDTHVIRFENLRVNEGAIASVADRAVHKVVFVGDASGSANYTGFDASLISRVLIGIDSGFESYDDTDPLIIADVTQDGTLSGFDSSLVNREALNRDNDPGQVLDIPPVPAGTISLATGLVDPQFSIPTGLLGNGEWLWAPIHLDIAALEVGGVIAATFTVAYDPSLLAFGEATLGAATPAEVGWSIDATESAPGEVTVSLYGTAPALPEGLNQLALLRFSVLASAEGPSPLLIAPADSGDAGLLWTAVDGSVDLSRVAGDYNRDGRVDAADYSWWRDLEGANVTPSTSADGDGDGRIDDGDYQVWRLNYGATLPPPLPPQPFATAVAAPQLTAGAANEADFWATGPGQLAASLSEAPGAAFSAIGNWSKHSVEPPLPLISSAPSGEEPEMPGLRAAITRRMTLASAPITWELETAARRVPAQLLVDRVGEPSDHRRRVAKSEADAAFAEWGRVGVEIPGFDGSGDV